MTGMRNARTIGVTALIAAGLYLSGLLVILTPLPLIYASALRGRWAGIGAAVLALAAVAGCYAVLVPAGSVPIAAGIASYIPIPGEGLAPYLTVPMLRIIGVGYFGFYAAVALALGEGARFRWGIGRWAATGLAAGCGVLLAMGALAWFAGAGNAVTSTESYIRFIVDEIVKANATSETAGTQAMLLADHADEIVAFVLRVVPSLVFVFAVITVAINIAIGRRIVRSHHAFAHVHNVARFRLPDEMVWVVIASGIAFFADRYLLQTGWISAVALNGLIALGALYFFQGLAVTVYLLQGLKFPLLRTMAYVAMIIFLQAASVALVVIGVADVWVDFRLRRWRAIHHRT